MIYISEHADIRIRNYLDSIGEVGLIHETPLVYREVSSHPDIYMCSLGDEVMHAEPSELEFRYPGNCAFNAACTGKFFIHNLRCTAPRLLKRAEEKHLYIIDVPQGYTKCNVAVIDEDSIITSDRGIYERTKEIMDVLLIEESTGENPHILLKGFPYGFIGGASGKIGSRIIFNGRISSHPDYPAIRRFIEKRGLEILEFDYPLEDIGSIIYE